MTTFKTWEEARRTAETQANKYGIAYGITAPTAFEKGWGILMLPKPENRQGFELRCEVVEPKI